MLEFLLKFHVKKWQPFIIPCASKQFKHNQSMLIHSALRKCITISIKYFNCKYTYIMKVKLSYHMQQI